MYYIHNKQSSTWIINLKIIEKYLRLQIACMQPGHSLARSGVARDVFGGMQPPPSNIRNIKKI
jgi:hypothetical protein